MKSQITLIINFTLKLILHNGMFLRTDKTQIIKKVKI